MTALIESTAWLKLKEHYKTIKNSHMRELFEQDAQRFEKFSITCNELLLDYSKNRITSETMTLLFDLARQAGVEQWRDKMFSGEAINTTENRSVLHTALRNRSANPVIVDDQDVMPKVNAVLARMRTFCEQVHSGEWSGYNGKKIKTIVNIGIGGSDLGPNMVCDAMKAFAQPDLKAYFVSNVDASHLVEILKEVEAESTLFVIASKTFTTQETMLNAFSARTWFVDCVGDENAIEKHFVALTTNTKRAKEFGINENNMFEFWDWVGGRYSLWSSVGLSIALYIGMDNFEALLEGAYEMDQHFQEAPIEENIPVILALLGVWYNNFFDARSHAIMPYSQYLERLPDYLQQLDMESNGKTIGRDNNQVDYLTGAVIWGKPGTNGQHAFFQLLHQGTQLVPADFLMPILSENSLEEHQEVLFSNFLAQTEALMKGKTLSEVIAEMELQGSNEELITAIAPHKVFAGNKPTNTLLFQRLTPKILGSLLAMYEHKVFVQGIIWNINSFDQWGVEYGKVLASNILKDLATNNTITTHDASTNALINLAKQTYTNQ